MSKTKRTKNEVREAIVAAGEEYMKNEKNGKACVNFKREYTLPFDLPYHRKEYYIRFWRGEWTYDQFTRACARNNHPSRPVNSTEEYFAEFVNPELDEGKVLSHKVSSVILNLAAQIMKMKGIQSYRADEYLLILAKI